MKSFFSWLVCLVISVGTLYGAEAQAVTFTVGGSMSGLASGKTVVLKNNTSTVLVPSTSTSFTFPAQNAGTNWNVSVAIQPSGQVCTVTNGSGTNISANVTNVSVSCAATYTVGGTVTGLTSGALVLRTGNITLVVNSGASTFKFASGLKSGSAYNVLAAIQPPGFQCLATNNSGVISNSNVTNIGITCARTYIVSGTIIGLSTPGLVLKLTYGVSLEKSATKTIQYTPPAVTLPFTFATGLKSGEQYEVTVAAQPSPQICLVFNGSGAITTQNINNVRVDCGLNTYTIGGTVSGTSGEVKLKLDNITNGTSVSLNVLGNSSYLSLPIGSLGDGTSTSAIAVNSRGEVTGGSTIGVVDHAFLFRAPGSLGMAATGIIDLGTLGGLNSAGYEINDYGQVVGASELANGQVHAFIYDGLMKDLGTLPGTERSVAMGINNFGDVVGVSGVSANNHLLEEPWNFSGHAFLYTRGVMNDLGDLGGGTSVATAINNRGQIAGISSVSNGKKHAFIYSDGVMTDIEASDSWCCSVPVDINDQGQIVGEAQAGDGNYHAFLYSNGVMTDLGIGSATGIDENGVVSGNSWVCTGQNVCQRYAFIYSNGVKTNLNNLVPGYALEEAIRPSANGFIAANSNPADNVYTGYRIEPRGSFTFAAQSAGSQWRVTVVESPIGQTCAVSNGEGVALNSNISNVAITCSMATVDMAGTISQAILGFSDDEIGQSIVGLSSNSNKDGNYENKNGAWIRVNNSEFDLINGNWVAQYNNYGSRIYSPSYLVSPDNCAQSEETPQGIVMKFCATPVYLEGKSLKDIGLYCKDSLGGVIVGCNADALFPKESMGYSIQVTYDQDQYQLRVPVDGFPVAVTMDDYISQKESFICNELNFSWTDLQKTVKRISKTKGTITWYEKSQGCSKVAATSEYNINNIGGIEVYVAITPPIVYKYDGFVHKDYAKIAALAPAGLNGNSQAGIYEGDVWDKDIPTNIYFGSGQYFMNPTAYQVIQSNYQIPPLP